MGVLPIQTKKKTVKEIKPAPRFLATSFVKAAPVSLEEEEEGLCKSSKGERNL